MVKEPLVGRVKTRLARDVGAVQAAAFYRKTYASILRRLSGRGRWQTEIGVTPDYAVSSTIWPKEYQRHPQGGGDLGARMQRVMDTLPPGPVIIIGTDVPGVTQRHIQAAFKALRSSDAVFGPSPDGGYWLTGLRRRPRIPQAFRSVKWSSRDTLAHTLANLGGLRVAETTTLTDVDEASDLDQAGKAVGRIILPAIEEPQPHLGNEKATLTR